jgi:hypothetical protein
LKGLELTYVGFRFGEDRFVGNPLDDAPELLTAHVWKDMLALASTGHPLAKKVVTLGRAMNEKRLAAHERRPVNAWAQEILSPIEENDETEHLDEAMAALSRALA